LTPSGFFASSGTGAQLISVVDGLVPYAVEQFHRALYRPDLIQELMSGDIRGRYERAAEHLNLKSVLQAGDAPLVEIIGVKTEGDETEISARVTARGGGIGRVEWRVNGVTQFAGRAIEGFDVEDSNELIIHRRFTLPATGKQNVIRIVAYNSDNLLGSEPVETAIDSTGEQRNLPGRLFVLAIGIDQYADDDLMLRFAASDAEKIATAFAGGGSAVFAEVVPVLLTNGGATRAGIEEAFTRVAAQIGPQDKFLFFAAGHGITRDGTYYFLPQDFAFAGAASWKSAIGQDDWQELFAKIKAQASVMIFDTCESGTLVGSERGNLDATNVAFDRLNYATGRSIITAATGEQPALEGYNGHGLLTWALLEAFAKADRNDDDLVDVGEFANFVEDEVPKLSVERYRTRQQPRKQIVADFPLATRSAKSLALSETESGTQAKTRKSDITHVAIAPADIVDAAGKIVGRLEAGQTVQVISVDAARALVSVHGRLSGYVPETMLVQLKF
jgi:hypothetical protein